MQIDLWEMEKNIVKSDFKKNSPIDGKNKIKRLLCGIMYGRVYFVCVSTGIRLDS